MTGRFMAALVMAGATAGSLPAQVGQPVELASLGAEAEVVGPGVFMWVGARTLMDGAPEVLENTLHFARRFGIRPARIRSVIETDPDAMVAAALGINVQPSAQPLTAGGTFVDKLETPALMANIGLY